MVKNNLKGRFSQVSDIIFDFDGIIVDSEYFFYLSAKSALSDYTTIREKYYYRYWTNIGNGLSRESERLNLSPDEKQMIKKKIEYNYTRFVNDNRIKAYDQINSILETLARLGKTLHIASNTPKETILKLLENNNISPSIFAAIHGKTADIRPKPHPDIFLLALKGIKNPPPGILVIEDTDKGAISAHNAGLGSIAIRSRHNVTAKFTHCLAVFDSHEHLLEFLQGL